MGQGQSRHGLRPGAVPADILPRLAAVKLSEIAEAASCSKAYPSDIRRRKWTPHLSTWAALGALVDAMVQSAARAADTRTVEMR